MDQKCMENIDVERCKELFEYEMTEVILLLKGEFATVSGKDLGLSEFHISEAMHDTLKEAAQGCIPIIEVSKFRIPAELAGKLADPIGPICSKIGANEGATQQSAGSIPYIPVCPPKPIACAHAFPLLKLEMPVHVSIPDTTRVQIPKNSRVQYILPQIKIPAVRNAPKTDTQNVTIQHDSVKVPSVSLFKVNIPRLTYTPIRISVPDSSNVSAECTKGAALSLPIKDWKAVQVDISDMDYSHTTIYRYLKEKTTASSVSKSVRSVVMNAASAADELSLQKITVPNIPCFDGLKKNTQAEVKKTVGISVPVSAVALDKDIPEIIVHKRKLAVPDIPFFGTLQVKKPDVRKHNVDIAVPPMPDVQKGLEEMQSITIR